MVFLTTVYTKTITATSDLPFQVDDVGTILTAINIHCYTNDAYYGNLGLQGAVIQANSVVWFDGRIRISDLWFKNYTAGQNTVITVIGILLEE